MRASSVLGSGGPFERSLADYELREAQLRMADMVEEVLEHQGVALIEAGTGTGKTLAYLIPALASGRRVVISTGTKTLQDQIMEQDLPLIRRVLDRPISAACLKGLGNYVCRRRYGELMGSPAATVPPLSRRLPLLRDWVSRTELADRAELDAIGEGDPIWAAVLSGSETRIGPRCAHHEACFVTEARRRAEKADIVVTNHHLFFADLSLRAHGGGILPNYDAVIFDEAHQVEEVATRFFGVAVSDGRIERLVSDANRIARASSEERTERVLRTVVGRAQAFFERIPVGEGGRFDLPSALFEGAEADAYYALDTALEAFALWAERQSADHDSMAQIARRASRLRDELGKVAEGTSTERVVWSERTARGRVVGASPVDVRSVFREEVLQRVDTVVLTSATLTTDDSFGFLRRRLGIDFEVDEAILPSPFDYERQAALYLPPLPDPRAADYLDAAEDEIVRLVELTRGGAFVLCTSVRRMERFAERCRRRLRGRPIYLQGEAPKRALLERFRRDTDAVLFATMSFWEGVDVPGDALRLVVIDRLPFDVPTDPLVEARLRRVEEEGESAFIRYLVPSAALTLKQGFGRLIRKTSDHGIVAVLDSRITTKGYGKVFLRSLPPARHVHSFEHLSAFYADRGRVDVADG